MPSNDSGLSGDGFKPLAETALFTPLQLGSLKLEHRIIQAPLTRMRGVKESDGVWAPGDLAVEYYGQRASKGGLQLTEATNISRLVCFPPFTLSTHILIKTRLQDTRASQEYSQKVSGQDGSAL